MKERLDILVVKNGFAESRELAQRYVRAGQVTVNGQPATKPGHRYDDSCSISVKSLQKYVSRGGEKLEGALKAFDVQVEGCVCLDIGASTGGFTDCLLQNGASRVYAVDVGKGQLHWKLRNDPRVTVIEECNARYLEQDNLPETPGFAVVDVSFISLTIILPAITPLLADRADIITLIKPQFEAGRKQVEKGGVVRNPEVHKAVIDKIKTFGMEEIGLEWIDLCESPLKGPAGNVEFLAWWRTANERA
jgi:23S rRNA (cytidine1920-2'-O)/16S rRNA (cytidine1409-2'-O)-methyltransferase